MSKPLQSPDFEAMLSRQVQDARPAAPPPQHLVINMGDGGSMTLVFSGSVSTTIVQAKP